MSTNVFLSKHTHIHTTNTLIYTSTNDRQLSSIDKKKISLYFYLYIHTQIRNEILVVINIVSSTDSKNKRKIKKEMKIKEII